MVLGSQRQYLANDNNNTGGDMLVNMTNTASLSRQYRHLLCNCSEGEMVRQWVHLGFWCVRVGVRVCV